MDSRLKRNLKICTIAHVVVVGGILCGSLVRFHRRPKNMEHTMVVQLAAAVPAPAPMPEPVLVPAPVRPLLKKKPSKPKRRKKIDVATNVVRRTTGKTPRPSPRLSEKDVLAKLSKGIPTGRTGSGSRDDFPFQWYYALVRETMYRAWEQPGTLAADAGLVATVSIRVRRDGLILERGLARSSGNAVMDKSVLAAIQSVSRLRALPDAYEGDSRRIRIDFALQDL